MLYYDTKKYDLVFDTDDVRFLEEKYGFKCLFGAMFAAQVFGISNHYSDYDFFLLIDKKESGIDAFRIFIKEKLLEVVCMDYHYILEKCNSYKMEIENYPSIYYRRNDNRVVNQNYLRDDFPTQILYECLYSDYIWDSGFLAENIKIILENISVKLVLDYYYTRVFGNLSNNMSKEKVPAVKCLMIVIGIGCMCGLIEKKKISMMNIENMIDEYIPYEYHSYLNKALNLQRNFIDTCNSSVGDIHSYNLPTENHFELTKEKMLEATHVQKKPLAYIEKDTEFVSWCFECMDTIRKEITKFDSCLTAEGLKIDERLNLNKLLKIL